MLVFQVEKLKVLYKDEKVCFAYVSVDNYDEILAQAALKPEDIMKKILALVLALVLCVGLLAGCGGAKDGKCEVDPNMECGWERIYQKLKKVGRLDALKCPIQIRNYATEEDV